LKTKTPLDSITHANALTGVLTINIANVKVNEFAIYERYNKEFPNLKIQYGENTNVTRAHTINFYSDDKALIPYYSVSTNGQKTLAELTAATGPAGTALTEPIKSSTET
jgi:hypothetical protein